jgi:hypothetical protein
VQPCFHPCHLLFHAMVLTRRFLGAADENMRLETISDWCDKRTRLHVPSIAIFSWSFQSAFQSNFRFEISVLSFQASEHRQSITPGCTSMSLDQSAEHFARLRIYFQKEKREKMENYKKKKSKHKRSPNFWCYWIELNYLWLYIN